MKTNAKYLYRLICNIIIVAMMTVGFTYLWFSKINGMMDRAYENKGNWLVLVVAVAITFFSFNAFEGFTVCVNRIGFVVLSQALSVAVQCISHTALCVLLVGRFRKADDVLKMFIVISIIEIFVLTFYTWGATKLYRKLFPPYRTLVINGDYANSLVTNIRYVRDKFKIAAEIDRNVGIETISKLILEYEAIIINDIPTEERNDILKICFDNDKRVYFTPKIGDIFVKYAADLHIVDTPLFLSRNKRLPFTQRFIKRTIDIFISLIGIVITSPIMLVTAIVIHFSDGGPVFYRQRRCTIGGREFEILKFRSMRVDAEKDGRAVLAQANDDRITPVGRFIRSTRIDELPQFFNIFKGEMSVVGPRPERPEIIKKYVKDMPEFDFRLKVKAGLTGFAQIYGKYNTSSYDKLKLDMMYVQSISTWVDLRLILLTLRVILQKEATDGVAKNKTDASTGKRKGK